MDRDKEHLPNVLRCTGQPLPAEQYPAQNVSAEIEKPRSMVIK